MRYIKLTCSAPLQYYARQNYSPLEGYYLTERHPTKRAITGMLGAALGINRGDPELSRLADRIKVKYTVYDKAEKKTDKNARVSTFMDFQIVRPLPGSMFHTAKGGIITEPVKNGMIKHVELIEDAIFYVYVGAEDGDFLHTLYNALLDPVYPMYFGKRRCIPNKRISETEFRTLSEEEIGDVHDCL